MVLTVGLLVGLDGVDKMSKSKGNHVAILDPPDEMFGKLMSVSDSTMWSYYPLLLDSTPDPATTDPLAAKKGLAKVMVKKFHGELAAEDTASWWDAGRPPRNVEECALPPGPLYQIVVASGLAKSANDARRKIQQ